MPTLTFHRTSSHYLPEPRRIEGSQIRHMSVLACHDLVVKEFTILNALKRAWSKAGDDLRKELKNTIQVTEDNIVTVWDESRCLQRRRSLPAVADSSTRRRRSRNTTRGEQQHSRRSVSVGRQRVV